MFKEDIFPFRKIRDQRIPIFLGQSFVDHFDDDIRHANITPYPSQQKFKHYTTEDTNNHSESHGFSQ